MPEFFSHASGALHHFVLGNFVILAASGLTMHIINCLDLTGCENRSIQPSSEFKIVT